MKVEKNSPMAQMLLKLAAEHDTKLREAIRNGEVEGVNIIAVGGAPDGEVKELLESLAKNEDAKAATPCDDTEDADDDISIVMKSAISPMTRTFLKASRPRPASFWYPPNSWTS